MAKRTLEDRQSELMEAIRAVRDALDNLECAESCETVEDFDANIGDALIGLKTALSEVKEVA